MSLLLLAGVPFSWVLDTARELSQAYSAWRTSTRRYVRAYSERQVIVVVNVCGCSASDDDPAYNPTRRAEVASIFPNAERQQHSEVWQATLTISLVILLHLACVIVAKHRAAGGR